MTTELPPSIADAEFPEEAGHPVFERALPVAPPPPVTKRPSKRRRPRKYRVAMKTDTVDSSMQVTRSGPKPAASDMARSHISQIPLREPQIIWVRSSTKIHPFKVTQDDPDRHELLWTNRQEELFHTWRELCGERSVRHGVCAKRNKWRHRIISLCMILIPTCLSGITQVYSPPMLITFGFITNGILSGIQALFNFGGLYVLHNEFSAKYEDFKREMDTELIKPKSLRIACDVYLKSCEMELNALTRQAPDL